NKPIWPENPPQSAKIPPHDSQSVKKSDPQQATAPTQSEFQQPVRAIPAKECRGFASGIA
ncbi:hypothetical protein, partial [Rhizobium sp. NZLR5]|uniref:hypothetical protein n=1 Tax=Rhizobium sp. NZLR5 TaxID=2731103 RepID=UPI001C82C755